MKSPGRDCRLLSPVLVALAYDEAHPETKPLLVHLRSCAHCRHELDQLRETRGWIEQADLQASTTVQPSRPRWLQKSLVAAAFAAAILGASMLFVGQPDREDSSLRLAAPRTDTSRWFAAPAAATLTAMAFELDRFDTRLEVLQEDLGALQEDGGW